MVESSVMCMTERTTSYGSLRSVSPRCIVHQSQSYCLKQDDNFGPTFRFVTSPEVGPGATVGTLKLGYPLLLCLR